MPSPVDPGAAGISTNSSNPPSPNPGRPDHGSAGAPASRLAALLFTDIVDSTGLKSRAGTPTYTANLQRHNALFENIVAGCADAKVIKHTGDGFFARFATSSEAVRCALRFQHDLNVEPWNGEPLRVRIGIHLGEIAVVRMANRTDVVGSPADVAARVMSLGSGGQILLSAAAADEARRFVTGDAIRWSCHGKYRLKGVIDPVEIWEIADANAPTAPMPPGAIGGPPAGAKPAPGPLDQPTQIGPYRILEPIGEGGMGTVYKAEQRSPVRRTVALKLIKIGYDTAEVIARFQSERQALARMDHPNVAKVLDAGADDRGRPYFVMEYVPGVPITRFADENRLSVRQRLDLFTQVCDAIAHAHSKALIHRDIKASNVLAHLADGKPTVKVIDFGIAKALTGDRLTDKTFNTQRGQAIGTYESMSPEQADGSPDIDTRTDVYSLGVLLYELLTGSKPFDDGTLAKAADEEIRRIIREVEPPRPSTRLSSSGDEGSAVAAARRAQLDALTKQLRSELEWIPLMAMRKERDRRYASPLQLADDIRNYLAGVPLIAGPESRVYRLRKFARRNRTGLVTAAAFLGLVAGGTATYVHSIRAEQSRTEVARTQAEANFAQALITVDQFVTDVSRDELAVIPGMQESRERWARRAIERYTQFARERPGDPRVRLGLARAHEALSGAVGGIGSFDEAVRELRVADSLLRENLTDAPTARESSIELAKVQYALGVLYWEVGELDKARPFAEDAARSFERLVSERPTDGETSLLLARAYNSLGNVRRESDEVSDAQSDYEHSRAIYAALMPTYPRKLDCLSGIAMPIHNLALAVKTAGQFERAGELLDECDRYTTQALALAPNDPKLLSDNALSYHNRATLMVAMKRADDAHRWFDRAVAGLREVVRQNPKVTRFQWLLADSLKRYAEFRGTCHEFDASLALFVESSTILDRLTRQTDDRPIYGESLLAALAAIAEFHGGSAGEGKRDAVAYKKALDDAVAGGRRLAPKFPAAVQLNFQFADAIFRRAVFDYDAERFDDAWPLLVESLDVARRHVFTGKARLPAFQVARAAEWASTAATAARKRGRPDDLANVADTADAICGDTKQAGIVDALGAIVFQRARALLDARRYADGADALTRALDRCRPALASAPWHPFLRQHVAEMDQALADARRELADLPAELQARREWQRVWGEPICCVPNPATAPSVSGGGTSEVEWLRRVMAEDSQRKYVTALVTAEFAGRRYPVTAPLPYKPGTRDPLENIARWIEEERGGTIPQDERLRYRKLAEMTVRKDVTLPEADRLERVAKENNVSLEELTDYVIADRKNPKKAPAAPTAATKPAAR